MYTVEFLRSRRVWFEELLLQPASSSTKRAHNMHVPGRMVAKTVLVKAGDRFVLAVLPCTSRIDLEPPGGGAGLLGLGRPPGDHRTSCWGSSPTASRGWCRRSASSTTWTRSST